MSSIAEEIDKTGFAAGDQFRDESDVRAYFTVANMRTMFGDDADWTQEQLDQMAEYVIDRRWHIQPI